ncbi:hypothetical protein [Streptomyces termitum]|uniref:hypothetical protein n=1 Tax=Streptomyces termitum TaxID=67368 RepID=UPI0033A957CD
MDAGLTREVQAVLARAGYGPGSGLSVEPYGEGARIGWNADALIRPSITAHAADPEVAGLVRMEGIRALLDRALLSVFHEAGFTATGTPEGDVLVTRRAAGH